jgi:hypothetical protein
MKVITHLKHLRRVEVQLRVWVWGSGDVQDMKWGKRFGYWVKSGVYDVKVRNSM